MLKWLELKFLEPSETYIPVSGGSEGSGVDGCIPSNNLIQTHLTSEKMYIHKNK